MKKHEFVSTAHEASWHLSDALNNVSFTGKAASRQFRVSGLPYCPLLDLIETLETTGVKTAETTYRQQFYFSIGHQVHDLWQSAMINSPEFGAKTYGSWRCSKCGKLKKNRMRPKRTCCGDAWEYEEVEYLYRELTGHSDLITANSDNGYTLWELKTGPLWFIRSKKAAEEYPGYRKALNQAQTYAALARTQYQLRINQIIVLYLSRETPEPSTFKFSAVDFSKDQARSIMRQLDLNVSGRKLATNILKERRRGQKLDPDMLKALYALRPCHSRSDYYEKMDYRWYGDDKCPIYKLGMCTKSQGDLKLEPLVRELY